MSNVTIVNDITNETHNYLRNLDIEGAAPILIERNYSHGGKEFLPDSASAKWNHGKVVEAITLGGYVLKKDRTTGQQRTSINYITPAHSSWGRSSYYLNAPEWLLDLFELEATK